MLRGLCNALSAWPRREVTWGLAEVSHGLGDLVFVVDEARLFRLYRAVPTFAPITRSTDVVGRRLHQVGLPDALLARLDEEVTRIFKRRQEGQRELQVELNPRGRVLRVRLVPMRVRRGALAAVAAVVCDITTEIEARRAQDLRQTFDRELAVLSIGFLRNSPTDHDAGIRRALGQGARFLAADRAYVVLIDEASSRMLRVSEWTAPGLPEADGQLRTLPLPLLPAWMRAMRNKGWVSIARVRELPPSWALEWAIFEAAGAQSVIAVRLRQEDALFGFVAFEAIRSVRDWTDLDLERLRALADLLAAAYLRQQIDDAHGQVLGPFGTLRDVTERNADAQEIARASAGSMCSAPSCAPSRDEVWAWHSMTSGQAQHHCGACDDCRSISSRSTRPSRVVC